MLDTAAGPPTGGDIVAAVTAPEPVSDSTVPVGIVVLVSGSGTNLQALIDAAADPATACASSRWGPTGRASPASTAPPPRASRPSCRVEDHADWSAWDEALAGLIGVHRPKLVVSAGFMKLLGPKVLGAHTVINTHPRCCRPSRARTRCATPWPTARRSPVHGPRRRRGVDTGPVIAQTAVDVRDDDTEESLHERIKAVERAMLVDVVGRAAHEGITVTDRKATIP